MKQRWPGITTLIEFGIQTEHAHKHAMSGSEKVFFDLQRRKRTRSNALRCIRNIAKRSQHVFDTAERIQQVTQTMILAEYPGFGTYPLQTFAFLPDFFYPGHVSTPPADKLIANLRNVEKPRKKTPHSGS